MFSQRTRWALSENAIAQAVEAHRRSGRAIVDLTETNPTSVGLPMPRELIANVLSAPQVFDYAPLAFGLLSARDAVSRYHRGAVAPERICLTSSTSEAYTWLFKLLCDPGDRVLVPSPGYPLFDYLAALEGVELASYRSRSWDDWSIDFEHLESQLTERTRAIVVVSPNNPTGALLHRADRERLIETCARHELALISDEVFADYVWNDVDRVRSLAGQSEVLTFVLSGLSKVCLLPQMKVGWIATSGPETLVREAIGRLEVIADSFLSVSTPSQLLVAPVLDGRDEIQAPMKERLRRNRRALEDALKTSSASVLPAGGGWCAVLQVPRTKTDSEWVLSMLDEAGVLVHPGFFFDFESDGYLVLSCIVPEATLEEGVRRLLRLIG